MQLSSTAFESIRANPAYQRPDLLKKAWALPVARHYVPLLSQGFRAVCGPTSVANVLQSMGVRAGKNPLRGLGLRAMSIEQVAIESSEVVPPGWQVRTVRPRNLDELRAELRASNDERHRHIANFARSSLFGAGSGHHSPLGGYLEDEDLAFVLNVNAHYGPWLVTAERLFNAISTTADWSTGKTRGLARFDHSEG